MWVLYILYAKYMLALNISILGWTILDLAVAMFTVTGALCGFLSSIIFRCVTKCFLTTKEVTVMFMMFLMFMFSWHPSSTWASLVEGLQTLPVVVIAVIYVGVRHLGAGLVADQSDHVVRGLAQALAEVVLLQWGQQSIQTKKRHKDINTYNLFCFEHNI